jgi:hypothetical protein
LHQRSEETGGGGEGLPGRSQIEIAGSRATEVGNYFTYGFLKVEPDGRISDR